MSDFDELVAKIRAVVSPYSGKINVVVRDREAFIDLQVPDGRHNPDFTSLGYKKIEITIKAT